MSLDPLLAAPLAVQIHAAAATAAMLLGAIVLFRPKGTPSHKLAGRIWVVLMLVTATSAMFIHEMRLIGPFSPIHILAVLTFTGLFEALREIRRGNVAGHLAAMKSLYLGALLLAGAFTLLPGRRMHAVLFGAESGLLPSLVAIPLVLAVTIRLWWHWRLMPKRRHRQTS